MKSAALQMQTLCFEHHLDSRRPQVDAFVKQMVYQYNA